MTKDESGKCFPASNLPGDATTLIIELDLQVRGLIYAAEDLNRSCERQAALGAAIEATLGPALDEMERLLDGR